MPAHFKAVSGLRILWAIGIEDVFDALAEGASDGKGQRQAGIVLAGLDGVDRLPRYAQQVGERCLGKVSIPS